MDQPTPSQLHAIQHTLIEFAEELTGLRGLSGGDSLTGAEDASIAAIQLTVRIEEHFNVEFPLSAVFDCPTLADLAGELHKTLAAQSPQQA